MILLDITMITLKLHRSILIFGVAKYDWLFDRFKSDLIRDYPFKLLIIEEWDKDKERYVLVYLLTKTNIIMYFF